MGVLALLATVGAVVFTLNSGAAEPERVEVNAVEDTYTSEDRPGQNFGDAAKLVATSQEGAAKVVYLMFTVPPISGGSHVTSAALHLTRGEGRFPATGVSIATVADLSWTESALTGENAPEPGGVVDTVPVDDKADKLTFDLTGVIGEGGRKYAFAVTAEETVRLNSSEAKGGPRLVLEVQESSVAAKPRRTPLASPSRASEVDPGASAAPGGEELQVQPGSCAVSAKLVPACGRWHGVAPLAHTATPRPAALADFEKRLGGPVDIMHTYHSGSQLFPTTAERKMAANHMLLINWKPSGKWADVAAGKADAQIDRLAAHITSTFTQKFFLAIYHEPENNVVERPGSGMQAADYKPMFRHVVERLRAKGVRNAVIVMNFMGAAKFGIQPWFGSLYPGDDVVDWVAYDPYGMGEPGFHGGDFDDLVNRGVSGKWIGMYNWLTKFHPNKPIMLGEWGVGEFRSKPENKAKLFETMAGLLGKYPAIKALVYFDAFDADPFGDTRINSSEQALSAYRRMTSAQPFAAVAPPRTS